MKFTIFGYEITIESADSVRRRLARQIEAIRAADYPGKAPIKIVRVKIAREHIYGKAEGAVTLAKAFVEDVFTDYGAGDIR